MRADVEIDEQFPLFWVNSTEMDFITAIENDHPLPIAFRDRAALNTWIENDGLATDKLGRRDDAVDVMLVHGLVKPGLLTKDDVGQGLFYRQVWARAGYDYYRNAVKFAIKSSEGGHKAVHLYDADHAVSRTRLANLWPDAWVNMVLVEKGVNRAVGAMLEKDPLNVPAKSDFIEMNAESILKTFFDRGDQKMERSQIRDYLKCARSRFIQFRNVSGGFLQAGTLELLDNLLASENAWGFFDKFADSLGVEPLERPSATGLVF